MGQIKLSPAVPSIPSAPLPPSQPKIGLPPAELHKQLSPVECLSPTDQTQLPTNLSTGSSQTSVSFLDDDAPTVDLPSGKEFMKLMQEVEQSNSPTPATLPPGKRRYLDDTIIQGKGALEKIRQAASQEPKSADAVKMLWLLEEHNKVTQGYKPDPGEQTINYMLAVKSALDSLGIDTRPAPKEGQLSAAEADRKLEEIKQQLQKQQLEYLDTLIKP